MHRLKDDVSFLLKYSCKYLREYSQNVLISTRIYDIMNAREFIIFDLNAITGVQIKDLFPAY